MARGFGMTALRAALGGVAGYGQDVAARRERERLDAEMRRQQERQAAMDRVAMRREGYMTPEEAGAERMAGGTALSRALASASGMMARSGAPAFGPGLGAGDGTDIVRGMGQLGPQQRETVGGQAFVRESPVAAALRTQELAFNRERMGEERKQEQARAEKQAAGEERVRALMATGDYTEAQARAEVFGGSTAYRPMTRAERDASARGWRALQDKQPPKTPTPAEEIDKRLPVGARNSIADYNAAIYAVDEARKLVQKSPEAFGWKQSVFAKLGTPGREIRERAFEKGKSAEYQRARAQLQAALMKTRKTYFGTQVTRLEKESGNEQFPSGSESPQRILEMLDVLAGNAENLRRGVYEANNAADLYRPLMVTPQKAAETAGKRGSALDELEDEGI
jgi:hypothetical protein